MRLVVILLTIVATFGFWFWLVTQEEAAFWHFIASGGLAGAAVGFICERWRGALVGLPFGCVLGFSAPGFIMAMMYG